MCSSDLAALGMALASRSHGGVLPPLPESTMATSELHRLPSLVRVRVVPPPGARSGELARVSWLTPYEAETIGEDARRAGPGTRLEVTVPRPTNDARLAAVRSLFEWLGTKGIDVIVREDEEEH